MRRIIAPSEWQKETATQQQKNGTDLTKVSPCKSAQFKIEESVIIDNMLCVRRVRFTFVFFFFFFARAQLYLILFMHRSDTLPFTISRAMCYLRLF